MSGDPRRISLGDGEGEGGPPHKRKSSDPRGLDDEKRPRHLVEPFPRGAPPPPPNISSRPPPFPLTRPPPPQMLGGLPLGVRPPPPPMGIRPPTLPPSLASSTERTAPTPPVRPVAAPLAFKKSSKPLAIKLGAPRSSASSSSSSDATARPKVAAIFGEDDDDEEDAEEMPMEAKMRMRNVGRETITSSGPNSFGKTRQGFVDSKRLFERQLQKAMEDVCEENKK